MRIIAGEHRGRKLLPPESDTTRPITDRAKQSLFDVLSPLIDGSCIYDCFAGTGSMGLESLSRGAQQAVFFERDRSALIRLKQNIQSLKVQERSRVVSLDIFKYFAAEPTPARKADLIFLDPPYRFLREKPADLHALSRSFAEKHLAVDGLVIFRHDGRDRLDLPGLPRVDLREYGDMMIEFLRAVAIDAKSTEQI